MNSIIRTIHKTIFAITAISGAFSAHASPNEIVSEDCLVGVAVGDFGENEWVDGQRVGDVSNLAEDIKNRLIDKGYTVLPDAVGRTPLLRLSTTVQRGSGVFDWQKITFINVSLYEIKSPRDYETIFENHLKIGTLNRMFYDTAKAQRRRILNVIETELPTCKIER